MSIKGRAVLLLEDEHHIAEGIILNLELMGLIVHHCSNGIDGLSKIEKVEIDLIILDLMMPKMDGHDFLKELRKSYDRLPVLVLSAKNTDQSKISCFREGVDDYMTKPFNLDEFLLRIERLLQRSSWNRQRPEDKKFFFGKNSIDFKTGIAKTEKSNIRLTTQEVKLLKFFFERKGEVLTRSELLEKGWGYHEGVGTRTLDNFMVRLRKYFEVDPKKPEFFKSVRGVGYFFEDDFGKKI